MPNRVSGHVDQGRRELGARRGNYHVPSADREGDSVAGSTTPHSIGLTVSGLSTMNLNVGATQLVLATVYNAVGAEIVGIHPTGWTTSDTRVATVDGNGLVTGVGAGTASIRATLGAIISNSLIATVASVGSSAVATSIRVTPATLVPVAGALDLITAQILDQFGQPFGANGTVITWSDNLGSGGVFASATSATNVNGSATVGLTVNSNAAISHRVHAVAGSLVGTSAIIDVQPLAGADATAALILEHLGPTIPVADMDGLGLGWYETLFHTDSEQQWSDFHEKWDAGNSIAGYDRAAIYYAWYARTLNPEYLTRATALVADYRDKYVLVNPQTQYPFGYDIVAHWIQADGLYLDWIVSGNTASRDAVLGIARTYSQYTLFGYLTNTGNPDLDPRIQSRVIHILWMAEKIEPAGLGPAGVSWTTYLDNAISQTLSVMNSDGYEVTTGACGGSTNFQYGLLYDLLGRIYDQRGANAGILTAMTHYATYAWNTQWRGANPADKSFNYLSVDCVQPNGGGSPTSAPDLDGLMLPLWGWLGVTLNDSAYFTKGDAVLDGIQQSTGIYLYRQFSESFSSSYRYLGYRYGA